MQQEQPVKIDLLGLASEEMRSEGPLRDLPAFRARQIARWLYAKGEHRFSAMTDLPSELRDLFDRHYNLAPDPLVTLTRADNGEAHKFLFGLADHKVIESVLIDSGNRRTICVSSQAGCAYGCTFCATAQMGPGRNLTPREIVSQVLSVRRYMLEAGLPEGHNIVFMGMGEPLANFKNLLIALRLLQADVGLGVGRRRITVSTVGLEPQIRALADSDVSVRLAFSLNATTDETRSRLMPINDRFPFRQVFEALRDFQRKKRMRVSLEYVLLAGINDTDEDARRLAEFASDLGCRLNLIVFNAHPASPFQPPKQARIVEFMEAAAPGAPSVTIRFSKGRDILAACGQLSTTWLARDPLAPADPS